MYGVSESGAEAVVECSSREWDSGVISSLLGGRAGWYADVDERRSNKDACGGRRGRTGNGSLLLRDRQWQ